MSYLLKKTTINTLLVLVSVAFTFLVVELTGRLIYNEWRFINFLAEERTLFSSSYPVEFDDELGWIPRPGASGNKNVWGTRVTIDEQGIRSNGSVQPATSSSKPLILAVGDSFTFGDQVSDSETWPSELEKISGFPVINGGVFGYGVDQVFLRMKRLVKQYQPDIVIFGLIADDIKRCEMSLRTAVYKPYFEIKEGRLHLMNNPVPRPFAPADTAYIKRLAGRSLVAHKIMMEIDAGQWLKGTNWNKVIRVHSDGEKVACMLLEELSQFRKDNNLSKIIVLVQYAKITRKFQLQMVRNVLRCVDTEEIEIVDLYDTLLRIVKADKSRFDNLFNNHMTHEGNKLVATILAERLQ